MKISIAGAPVSFGVFEMTPDGAEVIAPDAMLRILAETGYEGIDLGPVGYLGEGTELHERLRRYGLELAGGWIQLPMSDDDAFAASLPELHHTLEVFTAAVGDGQRRMPLPTLADHGSATRRGAPGRGSLVDPLDDAGWRRLVVNAERSAEIVRAAGFEPTFHHHAGTYVESPDEISRFLADTDMGLTLDVGHLAIAGGDPLAGIETWGKRINHLHLKDVRRTTLQSVLADGGGMPEVWSSGAFTAFGDGDIDVGAAMVAMDRVGYDGWVVVEQDVLCAPDVSLAEFSRSRASDQRTNRDMLRQWA